jgi:imidazolonepropionase-like amidohydrolase
MRPLSFVRPLAALAILSLTACTSPGREERGGALAIDDVTVIDLATGERLPNQTVATDAGRIVYVGPASNVGLPDGAMRVDGRGRFLIPGFWDMHVHLAGTDAWATLPVYLAYGVTGIRDMGSDFALTSEWRRRITSGALAGPRIVTAGPILDGPLGFPMPGPHRRWRIEVTDSMQAARVVDSLADLGVDFIKVHRRLRGDVGRVIAARAKARGLAVAGHLATGRSADTAIAAGQRSFEHLDNLAFPCGAAEAEALRARSPLEALFGSCGPENDSAMIRRLAEAGMWQTPTLVVQEFVAIGHLPGADNPRRRYVPPDVVRQLSAAGPFDPPDLPPDARARLAQLLEKRVTQVGAMHAAGVRLLVGSDAPGVSPGWSAHRELALFVRAGISPLGALRSATVEPARYLGAIDSIGTVAPGRIADLVLLDADPLQDISATLRIRAVIANGRYYDRAALDRMLREAETVARGR